MSAEWCDTDPPAQIQLGKGDRQTVKVFLRVPTREEARAAHHDAQIASAYDAVRGEAVVLVSNVASPFAVRVEEPGGAVLALSGGHVPGQVAAVRFALAPKR